MPEPSELRFSQARLHLVRWRGEEKPACPPNDLEVVVGRRWVRADAQLRRFLWRDGRTDIGETRARQVLVEACSAVTPGEEASTAAADRMRASSVRWAISPPLRLGASRSLFPERTAAAQESIREQIAGRVDQAVKEQAEAGWQRGRERHSGIESRSQTFAQLAGLTTTLVLANSAFIDGDDKLEGLQRAIVLPSLLLASAALILAGVFGMFGAMFTFDRVAPNSTLRVVNRAQLDKVWAGEEYVASVLLASKRTALVADWKLARLKRAMWCLLAGVLFIGVASAGLVAGT